MSTTQRFILIWAVSGLIAIGAGSFAAKAVTNGAITSACAQEVRW